MKRRKYRVVLYYYTSVEVEVMALDTTQAKEFARDKADCEACSKELLENLQEAGNDIKVFNDQTQDFEYV